MDQLQARRYTADDGIRYLARLARNTTNRQFRQMVEDGDAVHRTYGKLFSPDTLHRLTAQDFKEFLLYENNRHWWGIHRHQTKLVANMQRLRTVLQTLLDEERNIRNRIDWVEGAGGSKPLPGLGPAVYTPILHVVHPDRYGVWNSIAELAMQRLGFWPAFPRGSTPGQRYVQVNQAISHVAERLDVDRWTLDSLWWLTEKEHEPTRHHFSGGAPGSTASTSRSSRATAFFTCSSCFQLKAIGLRIAETDNCVDCL